jgi:hypothetical protein
MHRSPVVVWALLLPLTLAGVPIAAPVGDLVLAGRYSASLAGIPVGSARFQAALKNDRYILSGSGQTAGLSRIFYDGRATVAANGAFSEHDLLPASYHHHVVTSREPWQVSMAFSGNQVESLSLRPAPRQRPDRVPVTGEHKRNVLDPLSALMALGARGGGPKACDQTLRVFDGANRYDIVLAFKRTERFRTGWRSAPRPVHVCSVRYQPIAGHRPRGSTVRMLSENRDMEVWLAPVSASLSVPVRARVPTRLGALVLSATHLDVR